MGEFRGRGTGPTAQPRRVSARQVPRKRGHGRRRPQGIFTRDSTCRGVPVAQLYPFGAPWSSRLRGDRHIDARHPSTPMPWHRPVHARGGDRLRVGLGDDRPRTTGRRAMPERPARPGRPVKRALSAVAPERARRAAAAPRSPPSATHRAHDRRPVLVGEPRRQRRAHHPVPERPPPPLQRGVAAPYAAARYRNGQPSPAATAYRCSSYRATPSIRLSGPPLTSAALATCVSSCTSSASRRDRVLPGPLGRLQIHEAGVLGPHRLVGHRHPDTRWAASHESAMKITGARGWPPGSR